MMTTEHYTVLELILYLKQCTTNSVLHSLLWQTCKINLGHKLEVFWGQVREIN